MRSFLVLVAVLALASTASATFSYDKCSQKDCDAIESCLKKTQAWVECNDGRLEAAVESAALKSSIVDLQNSLNGICADFETAACGLDEIGAGAEKTANALREIKALFEAFKGVAIKSPAVTLDPKPDCKNCGIYWP